MAPSCQPGWSRSVCVFRRGSGGRDKVFAPGVTWQPQLRIDGEPRSATGKGQRKGVAGRTTGRAGSPTGMTELVLVRHGESQGNVAATLAHQSGAHVINVPARDADVELSETGREQALALGRLLVGFPEDGRAAVWSSPYLRARQTAELAVQHRRLGRRTVLLDERLRDRELGILDMLTVRRRGGPASPRSGAAALAGQVLLPSSGRGIVGRRRAAAALPDSRPGPPVRRPAGAAGLPRRRHPADPLHPGGADGARSCWTSLPRPRFSMPP